MAITGEDSRFSTFLVSLKEAIEDKVSNELIELMIEKYFGFQYNELINSSQFCYHFAFGLIGECLIPEESANRFGIDERQLNNRSQLMRKFVHNSIEYQLNLILVLCQIKRNLDLTDQLFDEIIKILSSDSNRVVTTEAFSHWFNCRSDYDFHYKVNAIANCVQFLNWNREAHEDIFFDNIY